MELVLKRFLFTDDGTPGVLLAGSKILCYTLERNWEDNKNDISCIPGDTQYLCQKVDTPHHGITYQVMDVPGRSGVLIHSGNTEIDTKGCILLGMQHDTLKAKDPHTGNTEDQLAVIRSKEAFEKFMDLMAGRQSFALRIKNC